MTESRKDGAIPFLWAGAIWRGVLHSRMMAFVSAVWERDPAQGPWLLSLSPLLVATEPRLSSQNSTLLQAGLPAPEPRVSDCKRDFVC